MIRSRGLRLPEFLWRIRKPGNRGHETVVAFGLGSGVGVEIPIAGNWTAKAEYLSTGFGSKRFTFPTAMEGFASDLTMQSVQVGLNYRIGDSGHISDFLTQDHRRWRRTASHSMLRRPI